MPSKKDVLLTVFFSAESSKSSLTEEESKNGDAIRPGISTKDGKLSTDEKPDQSESANGVEAQFGGSRARRMKKTDPHKEPGAIQKRPKQVNSLKPETSSSKDTWAEETDESKEKNDIFSKGETLPVQGEPDNNVDLYSKTQGKTNMNHCLGLVVGPTDSKEKVTMSLTVFLVESSPGFIEDSQDANEPLGESGADWKAPTVSEKDDLFFFLVQMP